MVSKIYNYLRKISDMLEKLLIWTTKVLFIGLIGINIVQIFLRTVCNFSFMWVQELSALLITGVVFLGGCVVVRRKKDPSLVFFINKYFSEKNKKIIRIAFNFLIIFFLVILLIYSVKFLTIRVLESPLYLPITMVWFSIPVIIFAIVSIFFIVEETWKDFQ